MVGFNFFCSLTYWPSGILFFGLVFNLAANPSNGEVYSRRSIDINPIAVYSKNDGDGIVFQRVHFPTPLTQT